MTTQFGLYVFKYTYINYAVPVPNVKLAFQPNYIVYTEESSNSYHQYTLVDDRCV